MGSLIIYPKIGDINFIITKLLLNKVQSMYNQWFKSSWVNWEWIIIILCENIAH